VRNLNGLALLKQMVVYREEAQDGRALCLLVSPGGVPWQPILSQLRARARIFQHLDLNYM
jgi:hypothetical protein